MSNVFLVGATGIQEMVVTPFRLTDWHLWNVSSETILYGDSGSLFIFDLEEEVLHQIVDGSYWSSKITEVRKKGVVTVLRIEIDLVDQISLGIANNTRLTEKIRQRLFRLTTGHVESIRRVMSLKVQK